MPLASVDPILKVDGLTVRYGSISAVQNATLEVGRGEAVAVIGSNGAGKTSILNGIYGLAPVQGGNVLLEGVPIRRMPTFQLGALGIGYVPEGRELFPGLSVNEELLIGGRGLNPARRAARMNEMFDLFPRLLERRTQITSTLSGGEQQMVAIARTLMGEPRLVLLDEPSLGLAPVIQDVVYDRLSTLRSEGLSLLLVEQNAMRALSLCDRAYVLELGRITKSGKGEDLVRDASIRNAYLGGE